MIKCETKQLDFSHIKVKAEPTDNFVSTVELNNSIKKEVPSVNFEKESEDIKINFKTERAVVNPNVEAFFENFKQSQVIKKEEPDDIHETPIKSKIKPEMIWEESNPSPFNKELFKSFGLSSPVVSEDSQSNSSKGEIRKSVKRTIFKRESPYKRYYQEELSNVSKLHVSVKDRLGQTIQNTSFQ